MANVYVYAWMYAVGWFVNGRVNKKKIGENEICAAINANLLAQHLHKCLLRHTKYSFICLSFRTQITATFPQHLRWKIKHATWRRGRHMYTQCCTMIFSLRNPISFSDIKEAWMDEIGLALYADALVKRRIRWKEKGKEQSHELCYAFPWTRSLYLYYSLNSLVITSSMVEDMKL